MQKIKVVHKLMVEQALQPLALIGAKRITK